MYTDPIADLLIRIKNAARAGKEEVVMPHSQIKEQIALNLKKRNFIADYKVEKGEKDSWKNLVVTLYENRASIETKRVSKPGQRIYVKADNIKKVNGGLGLLLISTSKGIMSGEEAKKAGLGGECICEIF